MKWKQDISLGENVCRRSGHKNQHISAASYKDVSRLESTSNISSFDTNIKSVVPHFKMFAFLDVCFRCISEGTIIDNGQLICLYLLVSKIEKYYLRWENSSLRRVFLNVNWVNVSAWSPPCRCKTWTSILVGATLFPLHRLNWQIHVHKSATPFFVWYFQKNLSDSKFAFNYKASQFGQD